MSAAPSTAEAMGFCGFDFLVLDMEHVPVGVPEATEILRAIGCTAAAAVVRLAWNDRILVKRMLDAGATTLMIPFVQNASEAQAAVSYARYPPDGVRGVAGIHRASRYGTAAGYLARANADVRLILQLETPAALASIGEIAAVPGVDALFVGPGDLSAAMGHLGDIEHETVQSALREAAAAAHSSRTPVGIVGPNPGMVSRFVDYGYDFVAISSDMAMMTGQATAFLAALRGTTPAVPNSVAY